MQWARDSLLCYWRWTSETINIWCGSFHLPTLCPDPSIVNQPSPAILANYRIADGSSLRRVGHCLCFLPDWVREREFHSPGILLLQEKCKEINHLLSIKVEQACKWRTRFQTNKTLISRFQMKGHCQQIYRTRNSQSSGKWTDDLICYYHQPPTPSNKN